MPMEASMNVGIRPVNRPQSAGGTEGISRREDGGGSSAAFSPKTNVSIQNAVDDMAGILSKISSNQAEAVDKMPQELQKIIQNVLKQAFSLEETMGQGLGSTLESQRFSMDQLSALSRMLSQLGNMAEKGMPIEVSDEMRVLLTNLKSMVASENGSSLEPVLLAKAAFELLDNKGFQELPKEVQALLLALQPQGQAAVMPENSGSSLGFLKQLVQYFMPRPAAAEGTPQTAQNTSQPQGQASGNGQTAAQQGQAGTPAGQPSGAQGGQTAQNMPQAAQNTSQPLRQANESGQSASQFQQGQAGTPAGQSSGVQGGQTAQNTPQAAQNTSQPQGQASGNGQAAAQQGQTGAPAGQSSGAQGGQTAQNTPQAAQNTSQTQGQASGNGQKAAPQGQAGAPAGQPSGALAGQAAQNTPQTAQNTGQPQRQANGSGQAATQNQQGQAAQQREPAASSIPNGQARNAPQQAAMQQAKAQLMSQTMENTPQAMQTMKSLAQLLMRNPEMNQHDVMLLQNFVNGQSGTLNEKDAKQLQQLIRLCQQNVPATVQQAAVQQNLPDLPRLWAFMQLCDMTFARRMTARQLKRAGKDVAMLVLSMRNSMEGDNSAVQGQRSLNFMVPMYMGEESTYPSYINVYNEKQPDPETGEMKKETWLRLCVLTDNIGAVELTCRVYNDTQLDMRVFFSSAETAEEFRQQAKSLRDSLKDSALRLNDLKIGASGERPFI